MKNVYIIIIVLIVLIGGGLLIMGQGNKVEAPEMTNENIRETENITIEENEGTNVEVDISGDMIGGLKEFTVSGKNFSFTPSTITVDQGDRVKITFKNTGGFHDFVINGYGVATKQAQAPFEEVLEFTADKAGSFEYYCSVGSHRAMGMKGILVVQ